MRSALIGLALAIGLGWPAAADSGLPPAESQRWDPVADTVSVTDDPAAPYIAYFTPPYRTVGAVDLAWSMMATRWRATGDVQLSLGVRMVHAGAGPWHIAGWRVTDPQFPPRMALSGTEPAAGSLKPLKTCNAGACRIYEAASFALPLAVLAQAAQTGAVELSIVSQTGRTQSIRFPAAILDDLRAKLALRQTAFADAQP